MKSYVAVVAVLSLLWVNATASINLSCSCGYYDASTQSLFTESSIVYFNESDTLGDFVAESYEHHYEKNWNSLYRRGATVSNVQSANSTPASLELYISPPTADHLVVGSRIVSRRQDIQYGTFRALLRSPSQDSGGSALSMTIEYNETESIGLNVMNTDSPSNAWVSTLLHSEFPSRSSGVNYSTFTNGSLSGSTTSPWDYMEYRVDWTKDLVQFHVADVLARSISADNDNGLPSTPASVYLEHWSIGDPYAMQGPPMQQSVANIGWIRIFFNSSLMSEDAHSEFDLRCQVPDACSVDDNTLRSFSSYPPESLLVYEPTTTESDLRWIAVWIGVACIALSSSLLLHNYVVRTKHAPRQEKLLSSPDVQSSRFDRLDTTRILTQMPPAILLSSSRVIDYSSSFLIDDDVSAKWDGSQSSTTYNSQTHLQSTSQSTSPSNSRLSTLVNVSVATDIGCKRKSPLQLAESNSAINVEEKGNMTGTPIENSVSPRKPPLPPRERVDYLAGLVALGCMLVSLTHFSLTFIPAVVIPGADAHYESEVWANKIIEPYLLNEIWIGVFFIASARFLIAKYLRNGDLITIAEKVVGRVFRLLVPVGAIAFLEYFLVQTGAIHWLQYLPSITWSSWPYSISYDNFSNFISEILELAYLMPNAVPQITFNYCTGVLWTIPIQLQGSWITLMAVIVVREIKTPGKRFGYYAMIVILNWYAQCWGAYFWLGLMLADLDITFKYKKWILARPLISYSLVLFYLMVIILCLSQDAVNQLTGFSFATIENNLHPDQITGLPLAQTPSAGYPQYATPKLHGLIFCTTFQALVELSPFVQNVFSHKILLWLFPHIFTIYLLHGFVFWSLGSWLCITLAVLGMPYWANMLVTALVCYGVLFLSAHIVTPVVEILGKNITKEIWRSSYDVPIKRKPTLYPFERDVLSKYKTITTEESSTKVSPGFNTTVVRGLKKGAEEDMNFF